jgi:hypothetical protein
MHAASANLHVTRAPLPPCALTHSGGLDPLGTPMTFADLMADRGAWDDESEVGGGGEDRLGGGGVVRGVPP